MSSIRLEAIRDGEEDYEYFILLDQLIAQHKTGPAVDAATKVREDAQKLVASMTDYDKTAPRISPSASTLVMPLRHFCRRNNP